jgi:hypothetical protein
VRQMTYDDFGTRSNTSMMISRLAFPSQVATWESARAVIELSVRAAAYYTRISLVGFGRCMAMPGRLPLEMQPIEP